MTTTTFKSVGGTTKTAAEPAKASAAAKPQKKPAKAAAKAAGKAGTVTIKGKGTIPVYGDGAMRRLPKGEPVKVSAAELAFLKRAKVALA
jgi:hypothetical protein